MFPGLIGGEIEVEGWAGPRFDQFVIDPHFDGDEIAIQITGIERVSEGLMLTEIDFGQANVQIDPRA